MVLATGIAHSLSNWPETEEVVGQGTNSAWRPNNTSLRQQAPALPGPNARPGRADCSLFFSRPSLASYFGCRRHKLLLNVPCIEAHLRSQGRSISRPQLQAIINTPLPRHIDLVAEQLEGLCCFAGFLEPETHVITDLCEGAKR